MGAADETRPDFVPDEWEKVKDLVFECQQQEPRDLSAWLDENCPTPKIRREVERLVRSASTCGDFLQLPVAQQYFAPPAVNQPETIGKYRVLEKIGSGGMGEVYAAFDPQLNRRVAIKILPSHSAADPEQRQRLRWDAQAASKLNHANIVTVHEVGSDQGMDYLVMECIAGQTLGRLIPDGGIEASEALRYAVQIASGLEAAHAEKIVHRDLKPGNIMITEAGAVKVLDFGLAKQSASGLSAGDTPPTIEGKFAGTVAYVSPEQAEGKAVDARSDIFSFGSVLYEMLTGKRAFPGDSPIGILADILHKEPPSLTEIKPRLDPRLAEIVHRCLRKKRDRRFQSVAEIRLRLLEIEEEIQFAEHDRSGTFAVLGRERPGSFWRGIALGVGATTVLAAGLFWLTRPVNPEIRLIRKTGDAGLTEFPAVSRDGKLLAYASDRSGNGNLDILVQQDKSNEALPITFDPSDDYEPVFSPDGTQIAYRSDRAGGGIYINDTFGKAERLIGPQGRGAQFSPDGKFLAYWTGQLGASLYPGTAKVWIVSITGGNRQQFRPDFPAAAVPVWAPEGDRLLFLGRGPGAKASDPQLDWWVASIHDRFAHPTGIRGLLGKSRFAPPTVNYWITPAEWLPENHKVLFAARFADSTNVWSLGLNASGVTSGDPERWTDGTMLELHPSARYESQKVSLTYSALTQATSVYQIPLNVRGQPSGEADVLVDGFDGISSPSVSADGSRLVFATRQPGGQIIRMKDLRSGEVKLIGIIRSQFVARPVLSGDGGTVAYVDQNTGYLLRVPNGAPVQICKPCGPPTHVSFDGRDVLVESPGPTEQILIASEGKAPRPLIQWAGSHPHMEFGGRFSPDGRWVAFYGAATESDSKHVWIAPVRKDSPVSEDELIPVTEGTSTDQEPFWAPDGRRIYFLSDRDGFTCVWARDLDPVTARPRGPAFVVTNLHHARRVIQGATTYPGDIGLSVSKDRLVFAVTEHTGNIWMKSESPTGR